MLSQNLAAKIAGQTTPCLYEDDDVSTTSSDSTLSIDSADRKSLDECPKETRQEAAPVPAEAAPVPTKAKGKQDREEAALLTSADSITNVYDGRLYLSGQMPVIKSKDRLRDRNVKVVIDLSDQSHPDKRLSDGCVVAIQHQPDNLISSIFHSLRLIVDYFESRGDFKIESLGDLAGKPISQLPIDYAPYSAADSSPVDTALLVCCYLGRSRSVTVLTALLMIAAFLNTRAETATAENIFHPVPFLRELQKKRPIGWPNCSFEAQLVLLHTCLQIFSKTWDGSNPRATPIRARKQQLTRILVFLDSYFCIPCLAFTEGFAYVAHQTAVELPLKPSEQSITHRFDSLGVYYNFFSSSIARYIAYARRCGLLGPHLGREIVCLLTAQPPTAQYLELASTAFASWTARPSSLRAVRPALSAREGAIGFYLHEPLKGPSEDWIGELTFPRRLFFSTVIPLQSVLRSCLGINDKNLMYTIPAHMLTLTFLEALTMAEDKFDRLLISSTTASVKNQIKHVKRIIHMIRKIKR